jgi:DDE family transposase
VKAECTESSQGRLIRRSFHAEYLERVQRYQNTPRFKQAMRKRSIWVEGLFAEAKQWHGLGKFRLRRLVNVNIQGLLIAAGQNLKRWLQATGWGHRAFPGAAWETLLPASQSRLTGYTAG